MAVVRCFLDWISGRAAARREAEEDFICLHHDSRDS